MLDQYGREGVILLLGMATSARWIQIQRIHPALLLLLHQRLSLWVQHAWHPRPHRLNQI
jgi:hypothetical protein